ncbi:MAG: MoaD/ThiS family protein [Nitrospiria bacterium]
MAFVYLTPLLSRHVDTAGFEVTGETLCEIFEAVFLERPALRPYLLDDQGRLRRHVTVFIDGQRLSDRETLNDPVRRSSEVYIMQALSGG